MMSSAVGSGRISRPVRPAARATVPAPAGFSLALGQLGGSSATDTKQPAGGPGEAAGLSALLGLQEHQALIDAEPRERDRRARRQGLAMLAALTDLQICLAGGDSGAVLDRLAILAGTMPAAADPVLAHVLAAIALRARVEIARRCHGIGG